MQKDDKKKERIVKSNQVDKMEEKLNEILDDNEISEEDADYVREMLNKIKIDMLSETNLKRKTLMNIKRTFYNLVTYFIIYLAMFGLFNTGITFTYKSVVILTALGLSIYQVLAQLIIKKIIKADKYYPRIFFLFSMITLILLCFTNENNQLFYFNRISNVLFYYFACEIIFFMIVLYRIKRIFNKL